MKLKPLNKEELTALYQKEMIFDFPHSELKPLSAILRLMDMGCYEPFLALEGEVPAGYALLWLAPESDSTLLEYLGVFRGKRNRGFGTGILNLLKERYTQIFCEAETPDSPDPNESNLRNRRIDFYKRNGFRMTDYQCALFGVRFNAFYYGPEKNDRKVEALHRSVYASYFSATHMDRYIQLPLYPGEAISLATEWIEEESY